VRKLYQNPTGKPPVWAEALLRALLARRSRDPIAGDLLEEYRESVLPAVGTVRAQIWYVRQVLSFLDVAALKEFVGMIPLPLLWGTAAAFLAWLLFIAVPDGIGMPVSSVLLLFTGIALTISGATGIRTLVKARFLVRTGFLAFVCFAVVTVLVSTAEVFRPALIIGAFAVIVTATGFQSARRTGQIRSGIAAAAATGVAATALVLALVGVLELRHPPLASAVVMPAAAATLGTIGALFGKRFGCADVEVLILVTNFL